MAEDEAARLALIAAILQLQELQLSKQSLRVGVLVGVVDAEVHSRRVRRAAPFVPAVELAAEAARGVDRQGDHAAWTVGQSVGRSVGRSVGQ